MNAQFNLFNINKLIKKNNKSINLNFGKQEDKNSKNFYKKISVGKKNVPRTSGTGRIDTNESFNRGGKYNDDINNRINSFLDFSMLNNKEDENNISKDNFGMIKNSVWDLYAINAKEISFIEKKE